MMGGSAEPYHCPCFLAHAEWRAGVISHVAGSTPDGILDRGRRVGIPEALHLGPGCARGAAISQACCGSTSRPTPPCEICTKPSHKELRGVEHRGRRVRNARPVAVNGSIGGHDPPRSSRELPGRYGHRLLPVCCPGAAVARTFATQSEPAARRRVKTGGARTWRGTGLAG